MADAAAREVAREAAQQDMEKNKSREVRIARAFLGKLPWQIQYAIVACDPSAASRADLECLAATESGRVYLSHLAEARSQTEANHISDRHRRPRLRLPSAEDGTSYAYTVVVGRTLPDAPQPGVWGVLRYLGPHRRECAATHSTRCSYACATTYCRTLPHITACYC